MAAGAEGPVCAGCGGPVELYMVHDAVWAEAGLSHDEGWWCLRCFEARLGRKLAPEDFTEAMANVPGYLPHSPELLERLGDVDLAARIRAGLTTPAGMTPSDEQVAEVVAYVESNLEPGSGFGHS